MCDGSAGGRRDGVERGWERGGFVAKASSTPRNRPVTYSLDSPFAGDPMHDPRGWAAGYD
jgi:hypothetical protein